MCNEMLQPLLFILTLNMSYERHFFVMRSASFGCSRLKIVKIVKFIVINADTDEKKLTSHNVDKRL